MIVSMFSVKEEKRLSAREWEWAGGWKSLGISH